MEQVILFGSYAAGRVDLFTDLDLLGMMPSTLDFVSHDAQLARQLKVGAPLDLLVYTPEETELMRPRPFLKHLFKTSRVLYEKKSS